VTGTFTLFTQPDTFSSTSSLYEFVFDTALQLKDTFFGGVPML
jgi:hypothetical protein